MMKFFTSIFLATLLVGTTTAKVPCRVLNLKGCLGECKEDFKACMNVKRKKVCKSKKIKCRATCKAATKCSDVPSCNKWVVHIDSHCGGDSIRPLEDDTPYPWKPSTTGKTIDDCKTKCVESPSCTAFVWQDLDVKCFWKSGTSEESRHSSVGYKCYSYTSHPLADPECNSGSSPSSNPSPRPSTSPSSSPSGGPSQSLSPSVSPSGSCNKWMVHSNYDCGGTDIIPILSHGEKTIDFCKTKCVESPSCTAFLWRARDSRCFWRSGASENTKVPRNHYNCYSYKSHPLADPECDSSSSPSSNPSPRPSTVAPSSSPLPCLPLDVHSCQNQCKGDTDCKDECAAASPCPLCREDIDDCVDEADPLWCLEQFPGGYCNTLTYFDLASKCKKTCGLCDCKLSGLPDVCHDYFKCHAPHDDATRPPVMSWANHWMKKCEWRCNLCKGCIFS